MIGLEIFLLIVGVACVVVSFVMPTKVESRQNTSIAPELSEFQLQVIKEKVESAVEQEIENVVEKTEISLDKISNTKIMEMQEYANTIFSEMNRNHNETMFLYDMLNEKSKDIKKIVRDLNVIRQGMGQESGESYKELSGEEQAANQLMVQLFMQAAEEEAAEAQACAALETQAEGVEPVQTKRTRSTTGKKTTSKTTASKSTKTSRTTKAEPKETEVTRTEQESNAELPAEESVEPKKKGTRGRKKKSETPDTREQIIAMYEEGKTDVEIAKTLGVGVGQTRLVIDLYEGQK